MQNVYFTYYEYRIWNDVCSLGCTISYVFICIRHKKGYQLNCCSAFSNKYARNFEINKMPYNVEYIIISNPIHCKIQKSCCKRKLYFDFGFNLIFFAFYTKYGRIRITHIWLQGKLHGYRFDSWFITESTRFLLSETFVLKN